MPILILTNEEARAVAIAMQFTNEMWGEGSSFPLSREAFCALAEQVERVAREPNLDDFEEVRARLASLGQQQNASEMEEDSLRARYTAHRRRFPDGARVRFRNDRQDFTGIIVRADCGDFTGAILYSVRTEAGDWAVYEDDVSEEGA